MRKKCTCDEDHPVNANRCNGVAVALWTCPEHGNLFEDRLLGITLTHQQKEVLRTFSEENKDGREPTIDSVSWKLNYSTWSVRRAVAVLQSVNLLEPNIR